MTYGSIKSFHYLKETSVLRECEQINRLLIMEGHCSYSSQPSTYPKVFASFICNPKGHQSANFILFDVVTARQEQEINSRT